MSDMLTREIQDNRLLRDYGQLDVTARRAAGAVFSTPQMTGLIGQQLELAGAANTARVPSEGFEAYALEQRERAAESSRLQAELRYISDPAERDEVFTRLRGIEDETKEAFDNLTRRAIDEGQTAKPEDLQSEYGDLGLTFDRPMAVSEARMLAENKRAEIVRQSIIAAGPGGFGAGAMKLGAGFASVATDPLEFASMFIPVVGPARMAAWAGRLGPVGARIAAGAVEGFVGSVVTEPIYMGLSRAQQLDYEMSDALMNVGLGTVFGAGIGAVASGIGYRTQAPVDSAPIERLDPALSREVGETALRQFVTGQTVDIGRFLDGTDLRGTTTISRSRGIEFQATKTVDVAPRGIDTRPTVLIQDKTGAVRVFETLGKADVAVEKLGGSVVTVKGGYAVRAPIEGDIVRDPYGRPLSFETERGAVKFVEGAREFTPEANHIVPITVGGKRRFAVTRDMPEEGAQAIRQAGDTLQVPDGVNTRERAVLPNADARIDQAVRGVVAESLTAKRLAEHAVSADSDPVANRQAAESVARDAAPVASRDTAVADTAAVEELRDLVGRVADMTPEERAILAESDGAVDAAETYAQLARVAANCVIR
jgi:hypothetical protein